MRKIIIFICAITLCFTGCSENIKNNLSEIIPNSENVLNIYTSLDKEKYTPIIREFEEETGIWVNINSGNTSDLLKDNSKIQSYDLIWAANIDILNTDCNLYCKLSNYNDKYFLPVAYDIPVIIYNPRLIKRNLPTGFCDIFNESWQRSFLFSEPMENEFNAAVLAAISNIFLEYEVFDFVDILNESLITVSLNDMEIINKVSDGLYSLAIVSESEALRAVEKGKNIRIIYPKEGSIAIPYFLSVNRSTNKKNQANKFIDFINSDETKEYMRKSFLYSPIDKDNITQNIIYIDTKDILDKKDEIMNIWEIISEAQK